MNKYDVIIFRTAQNHYTEVDFFNFYELKAENYNSFFQIKTKNSDYSILKYICYAYFWNMVSKPLLVSHKKNKMKIDESNSDLMIFKSIHVCLDGIFLLITFGVLCWFSVRY